jgi:ribosomal protein S18 acetylase RimI-like enzyme
VDAELRPATELAEDELAALFTAAYEGYVLPMAVTAEALRFLTTAYDLDRAASLVAVRDGEPVGLVNVGLRGPDAWIGGLGVVPAERRRGTGRRLMEAVQDEARARGAERVWLEVIVDNLQAAALYRDLGYEHVREVAVWSLAGADGDAAAECPAEEARAWIRGHRTDREPWQRADASVAHQDDVRGLAVDGAAALVRVVGGRVSVLQLAGTSDALRELLAGARSLGDSLSVLNLPDGHPAAAALEALGGRVDVRQRELVLAL